MSLEVLCCDSDDFCQVFLPQWEQELPACREHQRRHSVNFPASQGYDYHRLKGDGLSYIRRTTSYYAFHGSRPEAMAPD